MKKTRQNYLSYGFLSPLVHFLARERKIYDHLRMSKVGETVE